MLDEESRKRSQINDDETAQTDDNRESNLVINPDKNEGDKDSPLNAKLVDGIMPRLNKDQVQQGLALVGQRHTLSDTQLTVVLPYLKYLMCKCFRTRDDSYLASADNESITLQYSQTDEFEHFESESDEDQDQGIESKTKNIAATLFINKLAKDVKKNVKKYKEQEDLQIAAIVGQQDPIKLDPYLKYGLGIQSYFQLQTDLIKLFFVLSMLAIPSMLIYSYSGGLKTVYGEADVTFFDKYSYANIGFAETKCSRAPAIQNDETNQYEAKVIFKCQGDTKINTVYDAGVISAMDQDSLSICSLNKTDIDYNLYPEMEPFKRQDAIDKVNSTCYGLTSCNFELNISDYYPTTVAGLYSPTFERADFLIFYTQASCMYTPEGLQSKKQQGLAIACIGIFSCFFFSYSVHYMVMSAQLRDKVWDAQIITASDYTGYMNLNEKMYRQFQQERKEKAQRGEVNLEKSDLVLFKKELRFRMEQTLKQTFNNTEENGKNYHEIANISFAFNNSDVVQLLTMRGQALLNGNFKKATEIEKHITEKKNDQNILEQWTTPVGAYITFKYEGGIRLAVDSTQDTLKNFYGCNIESLKVAPEPSDIIWENRSIPKHKVRRRMYWLIFFIFIGSVITFIITIQLLQTKQIVKYITKPPGTVCSIIEEQLSGNYLKVNAYLEWQSNQETFKFQNIVWNHNLPVDYEGSLSCFCQNEKDSGVAFDKVYQVGLPGDANESEPICKRWSVIGSGFGYTFTQLVGQVIVITNFLFRLVFMTIAEYVGFHSRSKQANFIKTGVFYVTFFNTGILIALASMNSSDWNLPLLNKFFKGYYREIDEFWVDDIGHIIFSTMVANIYFPIIEWCMYWAIRLCYRMYDQRKLNPNDCTRTRATSLFQFVDLYSGATFYIHYKYSTLLNIAFVCLLYGSIMPLLYFVGLASYFVFYTVERLVLAYSYRKPPMYDNQMTIQSMQSLLICPILYCMIAAWTLTNQQVFQNKVYEIENLGDAQMPHHTFSDFFTQINPGTPIVILGFFMIINAIFQKQFRKCATQKVVKGEVLDNDEEDIFDAKKLEEFNGAYFDSLSKHARESWISEELSNRARLGIKTLSKKSMQDLRYVPEVQVTRYLQSISNYDILANPMYRERFLYVQTHITDRSKYIVSEYTKKEMKRYTNDIVRIGIDLAYFNDEMLKKIELDPIYLYHSKLSPKNTREQYKSILKQFPTKRYLIQENEENDSNDEEQPFSKPVE